MSLKISLHNTLTRSIDLLKPIDGKVFRMYCCGPTVYGRAHIGNFRTYVLQDLLRRLLEYSGLETLHVRNLTDVDDKTIRGAISESKSLGDFTNHWRDLFFADCKRLELLEPDVNPSAVAHIPEQIELIERLIEAGSAYASDSGSVYFRISSFSDYGKLSGHKPEVGKLNADARLNDADEYDKETTGDFVLWKARKEEDGENFYPSPWGDGRPGWHLECSAMCLKYLGDNFDLHSGGVDLTFPHHDNEIAQCEAVTGKDLCKYWFHIAHLMVDGGKMSKSLGNLYTLDDLAEWGFEAADLKYFFYTAHYRQTQNFSKDSLSAAASARKRLISYKEKLDKLAGDEKPSSADGSYFLDVVQALAEDLNSSKALGILHKSLKELCSKQGISAGEASSISKDLTKVLQLFGLNSFNQAASLPIPPEIESLAELRFEARKNKDWAESDRLRDELKDKGWEVKDGKDSWSLSKIG